MLKKQVRGLTLAALVAVSSVSVSLPSDAFAKRLGGGGSVGRSAPSMPQKSAPAGNQATSQPAQQQNLNKQQAAPAQQTPAAQPKRNWLGPIAGLAAGLGLAALFSHLGMGEGFANFMMMALLALVAFVVIRKIMSAMQGNQAKPALATQGAGSGYGAPQASTPQPVFQDNTVRKEQSPWSGSGQTQPAQTGFSNASSSGSGHQSAWDSFGSAQPHQTQFDLNQGFDAQSPVKVLPAGFDEQAFVSNAKKFYQMMQGLFDRGDVKGLGEYCSEDMMAYIRQELNARGSQLNVTDVVEVNADLVGFETDFGEQLATVLYSGKVREDQGGEPVAFEEVWLLTRPAQGGGWVLSGIHNLS